MSVGDAAAAFFTREVDGCEIPDSANTWRGVYGVGAVVVGAVALSAAWAMVEDGPFVVGDVSAGSVAQVVGQTVAVLAVGAVVLVALFAYVAFVTFMVAFGVAVLWLVSAVFGD